MLDTDTDRTSLADQEWCYNFESRHFCSLACQSGARPEHAPDSALEEESLRGSVWSQGFETWTQKVRDDGSRHNHLGSCCFQRKRPDSNQPIAPGPHPRTFSVFEQCHMENFQDNELVSLAYAGHKSRPPARLSVVGLSYRNLSIRKRRCWPTSVLPSILSFGQRLEPGAASCSRRRCHLVWES